MPISQMHDRITTALANAVGDTTYADGYNVLRWFLKGWVRHTDPLTQAHMTMFQFATDAEGTVIPKYSAQGYAILHAAFAGDLLCTLPAPTTEA